MNEYCQHMHKYTKLIFQQRMELYVHLKRNTIVLNFKGNGFINYFLNIPPIYAYISSSSKYFSFFKVNLTGNQI